MNKRKGMSLIVLVITILVMIILAGVVLVSLSDNNPIQEANRAKALDGFSSQQESFAKYYATNLAYYYEQKVVLDDELRKVINMNVAKSNWTIKLDGKAFFDVIDVADTSKTGISFAPFLDNTKLVGDETGNMRLLVLDNTEAYKVLTKKGKLSPENVLVVDKLVKGTTGNPTADDIKVIPMPR